MNKKFSTALILSLVSLLTSAWGSISLAQNATPPIELVPDPPDRYVVVKGDTLWGISGKFLKLPWRWPEIWQLNKEQIRDPHWIYPGDIVYLDKTADGQPRLRLGRPIGGRTDQDTSRLSQAGSVTKLQPQVRVGRAEGEAISSISASLIEPYLSKPLILDQTGLSKAARIIATQEGRVILGTGDIGYVRGITDESATEFQIFRPATPLKDPTTKQIIAYEAQYLGTAKLLRKGDPTTIMITSFDQDIGIGDRLLPAELPTLINYVPHPPDQPIEARVVSIYGSVGQGAQGSILTLNIGAKHGIEVGNVVAIWQYGRGIIDRTEPDKTKRNVILPDERNAEAFIFRVFDNISYALVMRAAAPIDVNDRVTQP